MPVVSKKVQVWVAIAVGLLALGGAFQRWQATFARTSQVEKLERRIDCLRMTIRLNWLENKIYSIETKHGTDATKMPGDLGSAYRRYRQEQEDLEILIRDYLKDHEGRAFYNP